MIDKLKKAGELKIQFTMNVNNVSSKCNDDKQYILKVIIQKQIELLKKLFQSLLTRYQLGLETSMKGIDFFFDSIDRLHCEVIE